MIKIRMTGAESSPKLRLMNRASPPSASPVTRAEEIRVAIEEDILLGRLAPGQRLDEQGLATKYLASRTPVREALRALEARQLITWETRRGPVIRQLELEEVLDIFQVMAELEGLCARLAARRRSEQDVKDLRRLHESCAKVAVDGGYEAFYLQNNLWHQKIYAMAANPFLRRQTEELRLRVAPYRRLITQQSGRMAGSVDEHEKVLNAIAAQDVETAHAAMRDHVAFLGRDATDWIHSLKNLNAVGSSLKGKG